MVTADVDKLTECNSSGGNIWYGLQLFILVRNSVTMNLVRAHEFYEDKNVFQKAIIFNYLLFIF